MRAGLRSDAFGANRRGVGAGKRRYGSGGLKADAARS